MGFKTIHAGLMASALICAAQPAQSAVIWNFQETGGNVVGVFSGTLNLSGMSFCCDIGFSGPVVNAGNGSVSTQLFGPDDFYQGISGPTFGAGGQVNASSWTGAALFVSGFGLGVPDGYAGGQLDGTLTFNGTSYASMGITPGTYVYTLPSDTITVNFDVAAAVPLPASLPLVLTALAALGVAGRRRA